MFQAMQLNEAWYDSEEEEASEPSTTANSHGCLDDVDAGTKASTGGDAGPEPFPFMALPLELRLQVYKWVHLLQPAVTGRASPWYPTPIYSPYVSRRVRAQPAAEDSIGTGDVDMPHVLPNPHAGPPPQPEPEDEPGLLCAFRPCNGLPTALLQANRQLYHEMRGIPFAADEFEFVNWFASGLWAARSFVRPLAPWQQAAMRYVRLDLLAKDLFRACAVDWLELCGLWAPGLQGLRLRVAGYGPFGAWAMAGLPGAHGVFDLPRQWLEAGLDRLAALRHLEIDLALPSWDGAAKLAWCAGLQDVINSKRTATQPHLKVTCVEKC